MAGTTATAPAEDRQVIRKVLIEIAADDVRAAYLKAVHVVSEAQGEYVQDSALNGTGTTAQGNLTLRVAVRRLGEVLDHLRGLGEVRSEQANGEDVTEQMVDIGARLRNEQSVEAEMLELLESRKNAPLTEILQLRDKLSQVRGEIERMTAQQERLGRLVSLATVLVIIRPADVPPPTQPAASIVSYFTDSIGAAWGQSLRFLADTLAGLLAVLVGGIIWWLAIIGVVVVVLRWRRRIALQPK